MRSKCLFFPERDPPAKQSGFGPHLLVNTPNSNEASPSIPQISDGLRNPIIILAVNLGEIVYSAFGRHNKNNNNNKNGGDGGVVGSNKKKQQEQTSPASGWFEDYL